MPEYQSPGVYVEETPSGAKPITGVGTSTAGFLGQTERGPVSPQFITSWLEYQRIYGSYVPDKSYLAYAVQGFFDNGGQRCFIGRIVGKEATFALLNHEKLIFSSIGRGRWGNKIYVSITRASRAELTTDKPESNWVKASVYHGGKAPENMVEQYDNLSLEAGTSNNLINTVNGNSHFIRVWWKLDKGDDIPETLSTLEPDGLSGGKDGKDITPADYKGDTKTIAGPKGAPAEDELFGRGTGFSALAIIDEIALLIVPDEVHENMDQLTQDAINQCANLKDRFAIVSAKLNAGQPAKLMPPQDTSYAGFYYPWIRVYDPSIDYTRLVPPSGHIAGIFARSDNERGVWKAPANEVVRGAVNLQMPITEELQDLLNPRGVNCLRDFRAEGRELRVWGARTMSSDPEWKYINVRRLLMFIEESIDEGTQWVVFELNDDTVWGRVVRMVTEFLTTLWRNGGLMGTKTEEAFFVRCDRTTMTQNDIDNGRLICYIGVAPVKPAEFVVFRISQKTADAGG